MPRIKCLLYLALKCGSDELLNLDKYCLREIINCRESTFLEHELFCCLLNFLTTDMVFGQIPREKVRAETAKES